MDQRERIADGDEALRAAFDYYLANLWTNMPAIVQSFDSVKGTCKVQPTIKARVRDAQGKEPWVTIPLLVDVPVIFLAGGGSVVTFPVKKDAECLIFLGSPGINAGQPQACIQVHATRM